MGGLLRFKEKEALKASSQIFAFLLKSEDFFQRFIAAKSCV